jgi:site-specific DNA recombinase
MIQNTGKGGLYRYYCCSSRLKKGPSACRGLRAPMEKLDGIVVGEVARQILEPARLCLFLRTLSSRGLCRRVRAGKTSDRRD